MEDESGDGDGISDHRRYDSFAGSTTGSSISLALSRDEGTAMSLPWLKDGRTLISASNLLNTPSRRFMPNKPTRKEIPVIPATAVEHIERSAFEPFMKQIGPDFLKFEKSKEVIYRDGIDDKPFKEELKGTPSLAAVPKVFFEEEFDLKNPRIFAAITGSTEDDTLMGEQIVQEKLSNYLDIVEANLVKEISDRSVQFFAALNNLKGLEEEAKVSIESSAKLKEHLLKIREEKAQKDLHRLRLQRRRANLVKVWRNVQAVGEIASAHSTIQVLLRQEDYFGALDLIDETRLILSGTQVQDKSHETSVLANPDKTTIDLRNIRLLENLPTRLDETSKLIGKLLEQDLLNMLGNDLQGVIKDAEIEYISQKSSSLDIRNAVSFSEEARQTDTPDDAGSDPLEASLGPIVTGLSRTSRIRESIESYREMVLREIRAAVRRHLPVSDSQDDGDGQTSSDKAIALAKSLRGMSQQDFMRIVMRTLSSLLCGLERVAGHIKLLKRKLDGQQSSKRAVDDLLEKELDDILSSAAELANLRCSKIVGVRSEQHSKLDFGEFYTSYCTLLSFVVLCESITKGLVVGLRGTVLTQTKSWLAHSHTQRLQKSAEAVSKETWTQVDLKDADIKLVDSIILLATQDTALVSPSQAEVSQNGDSSTIKKQVEIDSHAYFVVPATLHMLSLASDYLQLVTKIPSLVTEIMNKLLELLKQFNSRTCQVVLGAGALRSAGLKNITAKHLALASQSLSMLIALLPYMRETMRRFLGEKQAIVLTEFDRLKRDYQEHQKEVHAKLVSIMSDRMIIHCRTLRAQDWALGENDNNVSPYMETLVKETVLLHKVLSKYLPSQTFELILHQVFAVLKNKLMESYSEVDLKTGSGKVRMLNDAKYFRERLSELKGVSGPGSTLEAIVGEKTIVKPERIVDLTSTSRKALSISPGDFRKSMDRLRATSAEVGRQSMDKMRLKQDNASTSSVSATPPFTTMTANGSTVDLIATSEAPKELETPHEEKKEDLIFDADALKEGDSANGTGAAAEQRAQDVKDVFEERNAGAEEINAENGLTSQPSNVETDRPPLPPKDDGEVSTLTVPLSGTGPEVHASSQTAEPINGSDNVKSKGPQINEPKRREKGVDPDPLLPPEDPEEQERLV